MTTIYIILQVTGLISIIVLAIRGPKISKPAKLQGNSNFYIDDKGHVIHRQHGYTDHHEEHRQ